MESTQRSRNYQIVYHNCARSSANMISCLETVLGKADLVLFQEPWIFHDNETTISHTGYTAILPPNQRVRPRVMAFLSRTTRLQCTPRHDLCQDSDLQVLGLHAPGLQEVLIYNLYNERSLQEGQQEWTIERSLVNLQPTARTIACGDFNSHHPW
jgi:hypothetical protein